MFPVFDGIGRELIRYQVEHYEPKTALLAPLGRSIDQLWADLWASQHMLAAGPCTLLHGDPHIGNTYLLPDGTGGFLDFQLSVRGHWANDVTYLLVTGLTPEGRREHERGSCSGSYSSEQISAWAGLLSPNSYSTVLKERVLVVAADSGAIVGFGQLNPATGEVDAVYVLPDRQGEGIGRLLLADLEAQARARGIRMLELSATLNAVLFYAQAGYTRRHAAVHRLPTGVELECVRMGKEL